MSAKGYATELQIVTDLGTALTSEQQLQVAALLEQAEAYIDVYTGRAWLTGAVTDEAVTPFGPDVWMRYWPISSVENVKGRTRLHSSATKTLTSGTDYEVADAARGRLYIAPWDAYDYLTVSYTPATAVPTLVNTVTRLLVVERLQQMGSGGGGNIQSFSAFGQVSVTFRDEHLSPAVRDYLDLLRGPAVFA